MNEAENRFLNSRLQLPIPSRRIAFMKSTIQRALLAVAVATLGAGAVGTAAAQATSSAPSATPQHRGHFHHHFGGRFVGTLLRATQQLNLTTQQQASIKTILQNSHQGYQPGAAPQGPGMTVLGNPADPNFAAAVQNEQSKAQVRIQKETALAGQIYGVLTPTQQQQLPTVLASLQAKADAQRAQWAAKHAAGNG
jgi:Spy/CpxP family protein refolding chaperone